jgi:hypothetical protein
VLVALGPVGCGGGVGVLDDRRQPCRQRIDVAEYRCSGQAFGERRRGRLDLAGIASARRQPALHQRDLGVEVVETPSEMGERRLRVAGLPGPDLSFG